ncbi:hypothetical protein FHW88_000517 [Mucilaginibacter sp. SG538B]|uniref:hypothetical protein n=1 Tax=Mucilaginibacter sp. SG538B TaxID=2587021 RepID=UPI00159D648A|nr:hypothetical protein [Mucilaginibacter sp. SG538B]NVM62241.1 hypothetical protein [Mucilaginibacter sp. SG538B]
MKRKLILIIVISISFIVAAAIYWPIIQYARELNNMEKQAGYLIDKVEAYKKEHHNFPNIWMI